MRIKYFLLLIFTGMLELCTGQYVKEDILKHIETLQQLVQKAEAAKMDATREKMTVSTAEIFLKYADWDASHQKENTAEFNKVPGYKDSASQMALNLADVERRGIVAMLDNAAATLEQVLDGKIIRRPATNIDWSKVTNDNTQLTYNKKPVFLHDYSWKPKTKELNEYLGNLDGFFLTPAFVTDENGTIKASVVNELKTKPSGSMGFVFLNHKEPQPWVLKKYANFKTGERLFTAYDIDNPGARDMQNLLLKGTVPYMAGKKYSQLGYMLANEPHWNTIANTWATGVVSEYTKDKFRKWLQTKHASIADLNRLWKTNFAGFNDIKIDIPINQKLQGTPQWYDWMTFNTVRVTDWFTFLHDEIKKYDPKAKTHIKVMPQLWSDNKKDHGLDFENLTRLTEIIGNDASAERAFLKGVPKDWEKKYAVDWRELCMSYDFFKSVAPNKIIFNTEEHFLSTNKYRDLYMKPDYPRAIYWLATMQGLNAAQTWYWARNADGSIMDKAGKGYAGSINQQPAVVNEVAATMFDLNAFSEELTAMQQLQKPIRIFYSKTSAINIETHMDHLFDLYESVVFNGIPIGFATQDILNERKQGDWQVMCIYKTPFVTRIELKAIQQYLNDGGMVIIDNESLLKNEYGEPLPPLVKGKGNLVLVSSLADIKEKVMQAMADNKLLPPVKINETNSLGANGCFWKWIKDKKGDTILSVVNIGKTNATLHVGLTGTNENASCKNLLTGMQVSADPVLKPFDVFFVEVSAAK